MTKKVKFYCEIGKEYGYAVADNRYSSPSGVWLKDEKKFKYGEEFDNVNDMVKYIYKQFSKEKEGWCYHKGWGDGGHFKPVLPIKFDPVAGCYVLDCEDIQFTENDLKVLVLDACKEKAYGSVDTDYYSGLTDIYVTNDGRLVTKGPEGKYGHTSYTCIRIGTIIYKTEEEAESTE